MSKEIITTLEPRQVHALMALHNSVIFDSKDRVVHRTIKGVGLGAYQELKGDGLQEAAEEVLFEAKREKVERGGQRIT